jgi:hypothetical protein
MTVLRFAQFSGEIPKLLPRLLPDSGAQFAENVRLDDGGLTPVRGSRLEHSFVSPTAIQTIYKFNSTWLAWDEVVNAVPGPVDTDRLYYTGDGVPKMRVGSTIYDLEVPSPTGALTGTPVGVGSGDVTTRLYVYTFVTDFGEESEPCPISAEVNWQSGQTVTLSGFSSAPGGRAISKQRIYRSQSSSQSGTDLFLIAERAASNSNFSDTYLPNQFGEILPSRDWNPPPDDLKGLIAMPNGMMVGFTGKQLCFCEPFRPHAWPEKYRLTTSYEIVGLGTYASTVVAGTKGYPYVASGNSPENMIEERIEINLPCINGRGLVDLGYAVAYPSNDGLVVVSNGVARIVTDSLFTSPLWQKLSPSTVVSAQFSGRYFMSYSYTEEDMSVKSGTIIIDLSNTQPFVLRASSKYDAFFYEISTGKLFLLIDQNVYEWDAFQINSESMTWKSKKVVLNAPSSMGAIIVEGSTGMTLDEEAAMAEAIQEIEDYNAALFAIDSMGGEFNGSAINDYAINGDARLDDLEPTKFISVSVYCDGELIRVINQLNKVFRINGNKKGRYWEVQVNGTADVEQITLATTARELNEA